METPFQNDKTFMLPFHSAVSYCFMFSVECRIPYTHLPAPYFGMSHFLTTYFWILKIMAHLKERWWSKEVTRHQIDETSKSLKLLIISFKDNPKAMTITFWNVVEPKKSLKCHRISNTLRYCSQSWNNDQNLEPLIKQLPFHQHSKYAFGPVLVHL
jgi:hypothetical protein